ncbi:bifunctional DNA primase/polymerase [Streptomyces sioyaensis]|uniref:bifunctional DNA primase/polymerase n=1 Tax=Streptomyces sioyaensis TaxID=67364 RepID=UPI003D732B03
MIAEAVKAVQRGWWIFPLPPGEKHDPRLRWSKAATNDLSSVVAWWTARPQANIGIACKQSGLLVVDCDMPKSEYQLRGTRWEFLHDTHGPLVDGCDVLRAVCERYGGDWDELLRTYAVATTRMGLHLYFTWPPNLRASQGSIVRGILDVRNNGGKDGGYVLGAGSRTESGPYVLETDLAVAPAPRWLVELVREKPEPARPPRPQGRVSYAGPANYLGLVATVRSAPEGNRNQALLWAARSMVSDGATQQDIEETLTAPAVANGLSEKEVRDTIRSAHRLQSQKGT